MVDNYGSNPIEMRLDESIETIKIIKMTQEEKAKAYDEVIKKVDDYYKGKTKLYSDVDKTLEYIFPELKESEDERIRKEITELVMQPTWKTEKEFQRRKELVAWLEKQGEKIIPNTSDNNDDDK